MQKKTFDRIKPFLAVVFLQFGFAGMSVLAKAALNHGMSNYVLVVYRHVVATLVIAPFAVILDKFSLFASLLKHIHSYIYTLVHIHMQREEITKTNFPSLSYRKVRPKMTVPIFTKLLVLSLLEQVFFNTEPYSNYS